MVAMRAVFVFVMLVSGCAAESAAEKPVEKPVASTNEPPKTGNGYVTIACNPTCDEVLVEERSLGPSPIVRAEVEPGTHKLTLRRNHLPNAEMTITVKPGETLVRDVSLAAPATSASASASASTSAIAPNTKLPEGWLTVVCNPECDEMIIDGTRSLPKGKHADVKLPVGPHDITMKRKGAPDKQLKVTIATGQAIAMQVNMAGEQILTPAEEAELRKQIEPKVWAGKATLEEMRMLVAICHHVGDKTCRDRAAQMVKAAQGAEKKP